MCHDDLRGVKFHERRHYSCACESASLLLSSEPLASSVLQDRGSVKDACNRRTAILISRQLPLNERQEGEKKKKSHLFNASLRKHDPKPNPERTTELLCSSVSYSVNEIPLARPSKCHRFRNTSIRPRRWRGLWELRCQDLLSHPRF